ncbi:hypothetical protein F5Y15DRAFT_404652 [Xylariaceae sp. FL0016]|nr:hypothetical protein F5Y15DRAFT_404652 [Xylariaceae sp. FL0016]
MQGGASSSRRIKWYASVTLSKFLLFSSGLMHTSVVARNTITQGSCSYRNGCNPADCSIRHILADARLGDG